MHPYKLTNTFVSEASRLAGTRVHHGVVSGVVITNNKVCAVQVAGESIPADVVVVAMGPWSAQAAAWFKVPAIDADPYHSIVMRPAAPVTAHALFTDVNWHQDRHSQSPEVYPRPDGTVYICGPSEKPALPAEPEKIVSTETARQKLHGMAGIMSSALAAAQIVESNCCYLPCSPDGLPLIGRVPNVDGAYVATGHSCWGILNAPATGACMAELILTGRCDLFNMSAFDPGRFTSR